MENFSQVSVLFENLEQIEGIKKVSRVFWQKKLFFIVGSMFTFLVWAFHPFVLNYITTNFKPDEHPIIGTALLCFGVFMLFVMVFLLKNLTQRSFPELRETTAFWVMSYLLSAFALITLFAEIYFFQLAFNLFFTIGIVSLVVVYLTHEFWINKKRL